MRIVWHGPLTHPGSVRLTCPPVAAMDTHAPTSTHAMSHYEEINARPAYAPQGNTEARVTPAARLLSFANAHSAPRLVAPRVRP